MLYGTAAIGAAVAIGGRVLLRQVLLAKFRRDVARLNAGDHGPLLAAYADDAVLAFDTGDHRWAGTHRGTAAIEAFLREFTRAGLQGEVRDLWIGGPPWALRMVARFDDHALGPDGQQLYANRVVIVLQTRWGRIVHQEDFYEDTRRIDTFDARLHELGVTPATALRS
ncbi:nuclear transport factor 2 family protein [Nitriliruptor alkaliphilus]|uniref:nuclear transport factor 2 family protein n=1 Tax=Nitriliruptor alkaliphilus TaxID=427918 RepID=UPI0012EDDE56|nr:nuclear transport factor 2 family protein [Nitriliruptor alkaliphilus]